MAISKVKNKLSELDKELMEATKNVEEEASKRSMETMTIILEGIVAKVNNLS